MSFTLWFACHHIAERILSPFVCCEERSLQGGMKGELMELRLA